MIYYFMFFAMCFCFVVVVSIYETNYFKVKRYTFSKKNIENDVKILFLADLHENCFGERNHRLLDSIRKEQPDCILIGGDLIIGKGKRIKTEHALDFLREVQNIAPVYYTFGNHETRVSKSEEFRAYIEQVKKTEVVLLNNQSQRILAGKTEVALYGLELNEERYKHRTKGSLFEKRIFQNTNDKIIKILVAHTPEYFDDYVTQGPDFILAGHNHGGIVRLPVIKGIISTTGTFFPKYSYGIYKSGKTKMVLTAGAGTHTINFRLFNMSEIVTITIRKG